MTLTIKRHVWANRCLLAGFFKNICVIKERPGRAVKVRRAHYKTSIHGMCVQRLYLYSAFVKIQVMVPDQTSENLQQVSIMDGRKKGRIPSFCAPAA